MPGGGGGASGWKAARLEGHMHHACVDAPEQAEQPQCLLRVWLALKVVALDARLEGVELLQEGRHFCGGHASG